MAGPGGIPAGRAAVIVLPDVSKFLPSLKKYLERIERTLRIEVPVQLDPQGIKEDTERVKEQVRRNPATLPVKADTDPFLRSAQAIAARAEKQIEAQIPLTADGEKFRRELAVQLAKIQADADRLAVEIPVDAGDAAKARAELLAQIKELQFLAKRNKIEIEVDVDRGDSVKGFRARLAQLASTFRDIRDASRPFLKIGSVIGLATKNIAIFVALVGTGFHLAGLLADMVVTIGPAVATVVPAAVAAVGALAVLKVGMTGVADAVKLAFDPSKAKEFREALKGLSPQARSTVLALQSLQPAFAALRKSVQDTLFHGVAPLVKALGRNGGLLSAAQAGLTGIAELFNRAGRELGTFLTSVEGVRLVAQLFDNAKRALEPLTKAVTPFVRALAQIGVAAGPGLTLVTNKIRELAARFAAFINTRFQDGSLSQNITDAVAATLRLLGALGRLGRALFNTFADVGKGDTKGFTDTINSIAGAVEKFNKNGGGQKIHDFLYFIVQKIKEIDWKKLGDDIGTLAGAAKALGNAAVSAGNGLSWLKQQLSIPTQAGNLWTSITTSLTEEVGIWRGVWNSYMEFMRGIWESIKSQGVSLWHSFTTSLSEEAATWRGVWNSYMEFCRGIWEGIKSQGLTLYRGFTTALSEEVTVWQGRWAAYMEFCRGIWASIKSQAKTLYHGFTTALSEEVAAWRARWDGFLAFLGGIWARIKGQASQLWAGFKSALSAALSDMRSRWDGFVGFVRSIPGRITSAFSSLPGQLRQVGVDAVQGLIGGLTSMLDAVRGIAGRIADAVRSAAAAKLKLGSPSKVMMEVGKFAGQGLAAGIASQESTVASAAERLAAQVVRPAQFSAQSFARPGFPGGAVYVTVNNPVPETASESTTRIMRRLAVLGAPA